MSTNRIGTLLIVGAISVSSLSAASADSKVQPASYAHAIQLGGSDCTTCVGGSGFCQYANPRGMSVKYGNPCPKLANGCCSSWLTEVLFGIRNRIGGLLNAPLYADDGCGGCGSCGSCYGTELGKGRLRDYYPGLGLGCGGFLRSLFAPVGNSCDIDCSPLGGSSFAIGGTPLGSCTNGGCASGTCGSGSVISLSPTPANVESQLPVPSQQERAAPKTPTIDPEARRRRPVIRRTDYAELETLESRRSAASADKASIEKNVSRALRDLGLDQQIRFKNPTAKTSQPVIKTRTKARTAATRPAKKPAAARSVQFHPHAGKATYRTMFR